MSKEQEREHRGQKEVLSVSLGRKAMAITFLNDCSCGGATAEQGKREGSDRDELLCADHMLQLIT